MIILLELSKVLMPISLMRLIEDESGEIIDSCFGFIGEDSIHFNGYEEKDLEEIEVNLYSKK